MSDKITHVRVRENGSGVFTQDIVAGAHHFTADEPRDVGGDDAGPAPYDLLLSALGACTVMTLRMYARHKKWDVENIAVALTHRKDAGQDGQKRDILTREISLTGNLDAEQKQRLLEIANKCPVHRTLENSPEINSFLAS